MKAREIQLYRDVDDGESLQELKNTLSDIITPTKPNVFSPNELRVGMFVTVLENKRIELRPSIFSLNSSGLTQVETIKDNSGMGEILKIVAINLPFVAVEKQSKYAESRYVVPYDTRHSTFMEVSEAYILALHPNLKDIE